MADEVQVTGSPGKTTEGDQPNQFGLTAAIALIVGRDMIVAVLSLIFSILFIWYSRNTGHSTWEVWAPFFLAAAALLLGVPVYLAQRQRMTQPDPVPGYR